MARLKVRFSINKGRHGAPMAKLGKISEQAEKFLRSLAHDCEIPTKPGEWLAANFKNGSVGLVSIRLAAGSLVGVISPIKPPLPLGDK